MLISKEEKKMKRKLSYNGKTIQEMTKSELQTQYETNRKRMQIRAMFFGAIAIISFVVIPQVAIIPLAIGAITSYWLKKNNEEIQAEMSAR